MLKVPQWYIAGLGFKLAIFPNFRPPRSKILMIHNKLEVYVSVFKMNSCLDVCDGVWSQCRCSVYFESHTLWAGPEGVCCFGRVTDSWHQYCHVCHPVSRQQGNTSGKEATLVRSQDDQHFTALSQLSISSPFRVFIW